MLRPVYCWCVFVLRLDVFDFLPFSRNLHLWTWLSCAHTHTKLLHVLLDGSFAVRPTALYSTKAILADDANSTTHYLRQCCFRLGSIFDLPSLVVNTIKLCSSLFNLGLSTCSHRLKAGCQFVLIAWKLAVSLSSSLESWLLKHSLMGRLRLSHAPFAVFFCFVRRRLAICVRFMRAYSVLLEWGFRVTAGLPSR